MMNDNPLNDKPQIVDADSPPVDNQATQSQTVANKPQNKNLLLGVLAGVGVLLLILIALLAMLLMKKDSDSSTADSGSSTQSTETKQANSSPKKVVLFTVPTKNDKLEYVIYEPTQNASNTTINFGVKNICAGCEESEGIYTTTIGFDNRTGSYLVDDNNGKKYSTIKDEDNDVLATPTCSSSVKYGQTIDCFVSFARVPAGSTVSWVFGQTRIDGIKVE